MARSASPANRLILSDYLLPPTPIRMGISGFDTAPYQLIPCLFEGKPSSIIVFRYQDNYLAYHNLCVHMPFPLNRESPVIFSENRQHLRCSMHGIEFDPNTGKSLSSTMCIGDKLTQLETLQRDDEIWVYDIRLTPLMFD